MVSRRICVCPFAIFTWNFWDTTPGCVLDGSALPVCSCRLPLSRCDFCPKERRLAGRQRLRFVALVCAGADDDWATLVIAFVFFNSPIGTDSPHSAYQSIFRAKRCAKRCALPGSHARSLLIINTIDLAPNMLIMRRVTEGKGLSGGGPLRAVEVV